MEKEQETTQLLNELASSDECMARLFTAASCHCYRLEHIGFAEFWEEWSHVMHYKHQVTLTFISKCEKGKVQLKEMQQVKTEWGSMQELVKEVLEHITKKKEKLTEMINKCKGKCPTTEAFLLERIVFNNFKIEIFRRLQKEVDSIKDSPSGFFSLDKNCCLSAYQCRRTRAVRMLSRPAGFGPMASSISVPLTSISSPFSSISNVNNNLNVPVPAIGMPPIEVNVPYLSPVPLTY